MIARKEFEYHQYLEKPRSTADCFVQDVVPFIEDLGDRFISISEYGLDSGGSGGFGVITKFAIFYHSTE